MPLTLYNALAYAMADTWDAPRRWCPACMMLGQRHLALVRCVSCRRFLCRFHCSRPDGRCVFCVNPEPVDEFKISTQEPGPRGRPFGRVAEGPGQLQQEVERDAGECYQVKIHDTMDNDIKRRTRTEVGDFALQRRSSSPSPPKEATGKGGVTGGSKEGEAAGKEVKAEEEGVTTPKKPKPMAKAEPKGPSDAVLRKSAGLQLSVTTASVTADLADVREKVHPNIKMQAEEAKKELQGMQKAAEAALKAKDISGKGVKRSWRA